MRFGTVLAAPARWAERVWPRWARGNTGDRVFGGALLLASAAIPVLFLFMLLEIGEVAGPSVEKFGWRFLTASVWDPVAEEFGGLPFIWGTLFSSALALAIAVPISLGLAIFLSELAPRWLARPVAFLAELLAAIPSVVYGLWGIFVLVPWLREAVQPPLQEALGFLPFFRGAPYGIGMMAAGLILAVMVIPFISAVAREALRAVPNSQREASLAVGATKWETTWRVALPYARSGIVGAVLLGLGRALGETMAVTMVIGNNPSLSLSLFMPSQTMASVIANEFAEAAGDVYLGALMEVGLLLFAVTLLVNIAARILVWRLTPEGAS